MQQQQQLHTSEVDTVQNQLTGTSSCPSGEGLKQSQRHPHSGTANYKPLTQHLLTGKVSRRRAICRHCENTFVLADRPSEWMHQRGFSGGKKKKSGQRGQFYMCGCAFSRITGLDFLVCWLPCRRSPNLLRCTCQCYTLQAHA